MPWRDSSASANRVSSVCSLRSLGEASHLAARCDASIPFTARCDASASWGQLSGRTGVGGDVYCVLAEGVEGDEVEDGLVRGGEYDGGGRARLVGAGPVRRGYAPAVAGAPGPGS